MSNPFFDHPILKSPYECPTRHWELDLDGYREKPADDSDFTDGQGHQLTGPELPEAMARVKKENEAARLWISGLEAVNRKLGLARVIDLSATSFFLSGSGYFEDTLIPRTMSDFSLLGAIECGIVKLPRVPLAENIPGSELPVELISTRTQLQRRRYAAKRGVSNCQNEIRLPT